MIDNLQLGQFVLMLRWLLVIELLAIIVWPIAARLCAPAPRLTWALARPLGALLFAWLAWWVAWISRTGLNEFHLYILLALLASGIYFTAAKRGVSWRPRWDEGYRLNLAVYLAALLFFTFLVGLHSEIFGTEKVSDHHFLRACLDSLQVPPIDLWFADQSVNYYYFGYTLFATVAKLAGLATDHGAYVYNFAVISTPTLCAPLLFAIVWQGSGKRWLGVLAVLISLVAGNLHLFITLLSGKTFHFWDSSRAVTNTITEFPFFSIFLGDLHPHYMALPWVALALALLFLRFQGQSSRLWWVAIALAVGVSYTINAWNLPVVGLMMAMTLFLTTASRRRAFGQAALVGIAGLLMILPFLWHFESPGGAPLRFLPLTVKSRPDEFLLAWGTLWLPVWLGWWVVWRQKLYRAENLGWGVLLSSTGFGIALFMEFFYFDDLYDNATFRRGNTIFKFSYLYYLLLPLLIVQLWVMLQGTKGVWFRRLTMGLLALGLAYPVLTLRQAILEARQDDRPWTLDGELFMKRRDPDEYSAIQWVRRNLLGKEVLLLEAVERSHAWGGRVAAFSGVKSPLNWTVSQQIWRGHSAALWQRHDDLSAILNGKSDFMSLSQLRRYHIDYLVVGQRENELYPEMMRFEYKFPVVFEQGLIRILKVEGLETITPR